MKTKFLLILMAVFLPLSAFLLDVDEKKNKQEISLTPIVNGGSDNQNRNLIQLPVECCYFGMMDSIVTTVCSDLGYVALTVANCSTAACGTTRLIPLWSLRIYSLSPESQVTTKSYTPPNTALSTKEPSQSNNTTTIRCLNFTNP